MAVHKNELTPGNLYFSVSGKDIVKYDIPYTGIMYHSKDFVIGFNYIPFTRKYFNLVRKNLRILSERLAAIGINFNVQKSEEDQYFYVVLGDIKVREIQYLHEIQNLCRAMFDIEIATFDY